MSKIEKALAQFEGFYGLVVFGKFESLAQLREKIKNFSDVQLVYDKASPVKLYITEQRPEGVR